jgi:opacity protein-like surface antigen
MSRIYTSASAAVLALFLSSNAHAADAYTRGSTKDAPDAIEAPAPVRSWTGPWIAAMAGYGVLGVSDADYVEGVEGAFGELQAGYDVQLGRAVIGGYGCVGYSAIDQLNEHYCLGVRGGVLLTNATLLYVPFGWQWQNVDDGYSSGGVFYSGPSLGLGVETRISTNVALKVEADHQWVNDVDGTDVSDQNISDNRIKAGVVFRFGGALPYLGN